MTSEFQFIDGLRHKFGKPGKRIVAGIGDDAAVISQSSRNDMVISADMLVEDIDFRLDWAEPKFIGHKALAVSLSDIAAMGAKPLWSIVSIGIPKAAWEAGFLKEFYEGWAILAAKYGVKLVGGDISETIDKIVIDSVVGGEVRRNSAVKRSGARPGDLIYVTGELGGAAAGLKILKEGLERAGPAKALKTLKTLISRQLTPQPQCEIGRILGEFKIASAMIDVSDGLSSDLTHICAESQVGAMIYEERIPIDRNLKASGFPDAFDLALNGGEDFELLFTVPRRLKKDLRNKLKKLPVTQIGEITGSTGKIELQSQDGLKIIQAKGFRHF
jgi:thiamine-monophosphate kinase